jgi:hypothetical protein
LCLYPEAENSLSGVLTKDNDGNDAARIRGTCRETGVTPRRRNGKTPHVLVLADRASRSDPKAPRSPSKLQETKEMAPSNRDGDHLSADDGQDKSQDEIAWEHGPLLGYKVKDGKPLVRVPWYPTWEPPDDYSREVERAKRQYESRMLRKRRGRPPLRVIGSR